MKYKHGGVELETETEHELDYIWKRGSGSCYLTIDDIVISDAKSIKLIVDIDIKKCGVVLELIGGGSKVYAETDSGEFSCFIDFLGYGYSVIGNISNPQIKYLGNLLYGVQHLEIECNKDSPLAEISMNILDVPTGI